MKASCFINSIISLRFSLHFITGCISPLSLQCRELSLTKWVTSTLQSNSLPRCPSPFPSQPSSRLQYPTPCRRWKFYINETAEISVSPFAEHAANHYSIQMEFSLLSQFKQKKILIYGQRRRLALTNILLLSLAYLTFYSICNGSVSAHPERFNRW